jgi:hypothetical protein
VVVDIPVTRPLPLIIALRTAAALLLGVLLLDVSCAGESASGTILLVDGSLSMSTAGGQGTAAIDSVAGEYPGAEVRFFGVDPTGPDSAPGFGRSALTAGLVAAMAEGRKVVIVTDGEISDRALVPADLLARATVRLIPRRATVDQMVSRIDAPTRITLGDTLRFEVRIASTGEIGPGATLEILDGRGTSLARRPAGGNIVRFALPTRTLGAGDHLLTARATVATDQEPLNDARQFLVRVTPLPGAVVLADPPDWDARQLLATLRDVAALPVRGYARLGTQGWRDMSRGSRVTTEEVRRAVRGAQLVVQKGDGEEVLAGVRPRALWQWPSGEGGESQLEGEWYPAAPSGVSPLAGAWSGVAFDSLPPLDGVTPIEPEASEWVGLSVQLGRRGVERPVIIGRDSAGRRRLLVAADGLWRWGFRPGRSEEAYRQFVAASVNWLLGGADSSEGVARPMRPVVPLGAPVIFERNAVVPSAVIALTGDSLTRTDTLTFDGSGRAELRLPPGRYSYRWAGGGRGVMAVDRWSDEYLPQPVLLRTKEGSGVGQLIRNALREQWWIYFLIVALLSTEWWLRRRAGLR